MLSFFSNLISNASLRGKFLFAPIILLVTMLMISSISYLKLQDQKLALQVLEDEDLLVIGQLSIFSTRVSHVHAKLYDLLISARDGADEEEVYEVGRPLIEQLVGMEELFAVGLLKEYHIDGIDIYESIKRDFSRYKTSAISAIEMSTVDYMLARDELLVADEIFSHLVIELQEGLKVMSVHLGEDIGEHSEAMAAALEFFIVISVLAILGSAVVSLTLSRTLTGDFDSLIGVIKKLSMGEEVSVPTVSSGKEVIALANGINAFQQSLKKVDEQREALEEKNKQLNIEIVEREKTELDLIETRSRFQYALDYNPTIIYTAKPNKENLEITYVSENSRKIVGYDPADLLGDRAAWVERFGMEEGDSYAQEMTELLKSGIVVKDYQIKDSRGEIMWVQDSLMLSYSDGRASEVFGSLTDISEIKKSQEQLYSLNMKLYKLTSSLEEKVQERTSELEKANRDLEKLSESKSEFVSIVSHDLRTPLTGVKLFTDIMLDDIDDLDKETQIEYLSIISSETDRLSRLITNILDFQKIAAGKMQWSDVYCDVVGAIRDCVKPFAISFKAKGIDFGFECDEDELMTVIDVDRLSQVVYNLLSNALKFTEEGSVHAALRKVDTVDGGRLLLTVADTGPGIPAEQLKKIFEPFEQYEGVPELGKGTGLGLYIANCVSDRYHGRTWAESVVGVGSTFFVELPIRKEDSNIIGAQFVD